MTDFFGNLTLGFEVALTLKNLALCSVGCFVGTMIAVLPDVGPIATISMLLPITFGVDPVSAQIMLAGIYYGAQYGGSTTAILVNIPGESGAVITTLDVRWRGRAAPPSRHGDRLLPCRYGGDAADSHSRRHGQPIWPCLRAGGISFWPAARC
ncbi:MAG: tripartite tricarboxylate transporter permease [Rhizobiaceae bacterium]